MKKLGLLALNLIIAAVSALSAKAVVTDHNPPTAKISSPADKFKTNAPAFTVTGTATDDQRVEAVFWRWATSRDDASQGYYGYGPWNAVDTISNQYTKS